MATTLNKIGQFVFQSLTGHPEGLREHVAVESRSGVDGVSLFKTLNSSLIVALGSK